MFQARPHILVPLDLSAAAEAVLPNVYAIATTLDCDITLLHVVAPVSELMAIGDGSVVESSVAHACQQAWVDAARAALAGSAERIGGVVDVRVRIAVEHRVADAIIAAAREERPLLIAMTVRRGYGLGRLVKQTTADVVLRRIGVPVLIQHPDSGATLADKTPNATIVVALDGSPVAEQALMPAQALALASDATLVLVGPTLGSALAGDADALGEYVAHIADRLRMAGTRCRVRIGAGEAAEQIAAIAEQERAGLVVAATHGYSGPNHLTLGGIADDVARRLRRPLLLVPGYAGAEWPRPGTEQRGVEPLDAAYYIGDR